MVSRFRNKLRTFLPYKNEKTEKNAKQYHAYPQASSAIKGKYFAAIC